MAWHKYVRTHVRLDPSARPDLNVIDTAEQPDRGQRIESMDALF